MRALVVLLSLSLLTACAPLQPHNSAWGDAGEVALRVVACPVTLCTSELMLQMAYSAQERDRAYSRWYQGLSEAQQAREDARLNAAALSLGLALSGGSPFAQPAPALTAPRPAFNCTSYAIGDRAYLNCP